ncbi:unnamed protein product, partial [Choristocarpus tenellus]
MSPPRDGEGVLLYYKYIPIGEEWRSSIQAWYELVCRQGRLRGRVRVALDGVNCTLGGKQEALQQHIVDVCAHPVIQGSDIDFKLSDSPGARNKKASVESGFTGLSVKAVKEVVSLGEQGKGLSPRHGAPHVSPLEFHRLL